MRAVLVVLALVVGCGPLVQIGGGGKPPGALLALRAEGPAPAPATPGAPIRTILVVTPAVPGALQTLRVPVLTADTRLQYIVGAQWVEQPQRQFQRLLIDTLAARAGVVALDQRQFDGRADRRLTGTLREFGLDARTAEHRVVVRYDAQLLAADGSLAAVRRFETARAVASDTPNAVAEALNAAANAVAAEVAAWAAAG